MTFVAEIFLTVDPLSWEDEIVPFLDVLSCGLIQYPESVLILKNYTVAMLKISMHFPEKFIEYSKDHILDTVIKIYSGAFSNWHLLSDWESQFFRPCTFTPIEQFLKIRPAKFDSTVTRTTIEYFCKQLFILHRVPFVIELISVCSEALISNDRCLSEFVSAKIIYRLFESLAQVGTFWFFWIHCPLFHWKFNFLGFQSWWSQHWWWFQIGKYGTDRFNL